MDELRTIILTAPDTAPKKLVFQRFELRVLEGADEGARGEFGTGSVQVGTFRGADFVLTDPAVSRFHLKIDTEQDCFVVTDLDSTNGTYLGRHRIRAAYLEGETILELGETKLRFRPLRDQAEVEVPAAASLGPLVGGSLAMRTVYGLIERVAATDIPVIIEGETGTGKELAAQCIHSRSERRSGPFEVLDCGAVPENLIESDLFGHVRGAYTGAQESRSGLFERADGGTVFLDEVGELRLELQPKLLRVLETREIRRVGGNTSKAVDVRIVCATHRSLRALVNKGLFREDLYYRLAGCRIELPPLRERLEDIPLLTDHFLAQIRQREGSEVPASLPPEVLESFARRRWSGNVRELRLAVSRALLGLDDGGGGESASYDETSPELELNLPLKEAREGFERKYLAGLMGAHRDDLNAAAQAAQIHPKSLARLLRKYGLGRSRS